jgi:hypothetical protein
MNIKYYIYKLVCDNVRDFLYINFTKNPTQKKRYYKDNTYLTYKVHKNEVLYQTIRENGGWDNWRFIVIDEVNCTKYQIHNICEDYRKKELSYKKENLEKSQQIIRTVQDYSSKEMKKDNKVDIKEVKVINLDDSNIQENTRKYKKIQENTNNEDIIQENTKEIIQENTIDEEIIQKNTKDEEIIQKNTKDEDIIQENTIDEEIIQKNTIEIIQENTNDEEIIQENTNDEESIQENTKESIQENTNDEESIQENTNNEENIQEKERNDNQELEKNISVCELSKYHKELTNDLLELKLLNVNIGKKHRKHSIKSNTVTKNSKTLKCNRNI